MEDLSDGPGSGGPDRVLHLHRLEDEDDVSFRDLVPGAGHDLPDSSRHGRREATGRVAPPDRTAAFAAELEDPSGAPEQDASLDPDRPNGEHVSADANPLDPLAVSNDPERDLPPVDRGSLPFDPDVARLFRAGQPHEPIRQRVAPSHGSARPRG